MTGEGGVSRNVLDGMAVFLRLQFIAVFDKEPS